MLDESLSRTLNGLLASWVFEVIKRSDETKGCVVLPRRGVVERTFAWLGHYRRLSKDYEQLTQTSEAMISEAMISEAMIYAAMIRLMLKRLEANPAAAL